MILIYFYLRKKKGKLWFINFFVDPVFPEFCAPQPNRT